MSYITQIVLNDGRRYRVDPAAVPAHLMAAALALLPEALARGSAPMTVLHPNLTLHAGTRGPTLRAMIHGRIPPPYAELMPGHDDIPLVDIGVAPKSRGARALWASMVETTITLDDSGNPVPISPDAPEIADGPPGAPWLGVSIHPGFGVYPETHAWMGHFEQAIALAWVGGLARG